MKKIILASTSPRRKALLNQIGIPFEVIESEIDETIVFNSSPYENVKALASKKAHKVATNMKQSAIIIGADTIISFKGELLGKPLDDLSALENLKKLQGNKHTVYTGVCIIIIQEDGLLKEYTLVDNTDVYMKKMNDEEILKYLSTKEHIDKAGSYAIQGKGALMIEKIDGDYNTVVGLPLTKLYILLKQNGIDMMEYWNEN